MFFVVFLFSFYESFSAILFKVKNAACLWLICYKYVFLFCYTIFANIGCQFGLRI